MTCSQIGTGYLIRELGFTVPCLVICCLFVIACVFLLIFMPETLRRPDHIVLNPLVHLRKVSLSVLHTSPFCVSEKGVSAHLSHFSLLSI